jgi:2-polyprenyl-3-methyl-5-hydroxy-6-metoxy-1,4-benzoquinol methylase
MRSRMLNLRRDITRIARTKRLGRWPYEYSVCMSTASAYFHFVRGEIAPLLPASASYIVDVGCGAGGTLAWLKKLYPQAHTVGLEGNASLAEELAVNSDEFHIVDLNGDLPKIGSPDLLLFLDVLEHLPNPEKLLMRLTAQLAPGGTVIVSLPNIAHLSVSIPLLVWGRFNYADAGILDRTHLRFFVRESAVALMNGAGLKVDKIIESGLGGRKTRVLNWLTFGLLRQRLVAQYILSGSANNSG